VRLRDAIVRHWPLKLAALALSAILWTVVTLDEPATHLEDIRLDLAVAPTDALARPLPPIQALIAGPRREFLKLDATPLVIRAPVPRPDQDGHRHLLISPSDVEVPSDVNVTVQEIQPREIEIVLDRRAQKTVPVAVRATVEPQAGYVLAGPVRVEPRDVLVSGAASLLGGLDSVATAPLRLKGVTGNFQRTVPLDTTGHGVLRLTPPAVTLSGRAGKT
jgi:YbbR-like protein